MATFTLLPLRLFEHPRTSTASVIFRFMEKQQWKPWINQFGCMDTHSIDSLPHLQRIQIGENERIFEINSPCHDYACQHMVGFMQKSIQNQLSQIQAQINCCLIKQCAGHLCKDMNLCIEIKMIEVGNLKQTPIRKSKCCSFELCYKWHWWQYWRKIFLETI